MSRSWRRARRRGNPGRVPARQVTRAASTATRTRVGLSMGVGIRRADRATAATPPPLQPFPYSSPARDATGSRPRMIDRRSRGEAADGFLPSPAIQLPGWSIARPSRACSVDWARRAPGDGCLLPRQPRHQARGRPMLAPQRNIFGSMRASEIKFAGRGSIPASITVRLPVVPAEGGGRPCGIRCNADTDSTARRTAIR